MKKLSEKQLAWLEKYEEWLETDHGYTPHPYIKDLWLKPNGDAMNYSKKHGFKPLSWSKNNSGYIQSCVTKEKVHHLLQHRVVYETFVGPIPKGYQIDHLDNNRSNNSIENLEAVTREENIARGVKRRNHK